ncbi:MAG: NAD(P)-dependent glycerol-3-phosphate dehydrogenase, partial [Deltaproteobacteria bacterium]|nr:NAD(P)-dependent glycerol-3-phosphate dehydrogenase [Deltaproteobacteria bacterium]
KRENSTFLPGIRLPDNIHPSNDIAEVVSDKEIVLIVVPSHVLRSVAKSMAPYLWEKAIVVVATKGIENETFKTMTDVLKDILPTSYHDRLAVLSGPSFAKEVVKNIPTAVTIASSNADTAQQVQRIFATNFFRAYTSSDIIGVELGGALKNVMAIAAGVSDGLELGHNTRAALITRGLTEIRRLGLKLGANPRTFTGLAGMGDLVLTCTGDLSRNRTVGMKLGRGMKLKDILADMQMVAEGVKTTKSVYNLSRKLGVEMPIVEQTYHMLYDDLDPKIALKTLMTRSLKDELDNQ